MEKIKNALARARDEYAQNLGSTKEGLTRRSEESTNKIGDLADITYSQTRSVHLDPKHLESNRIIAHNKNDPNSSVFDLLRTQVLHQMDANNWRTLAITSPSEKAGKTVVSINLAFSIAHQLNKSVLLVDFDLRKPKIGRYLGFDMQTSLNEFIDDQCELSEVLVKPELSRLTVLPVRERINNSTEILTSNKVTRLISEIRNRYSSRIVIFDLPPMLIADDAMALLPEMDCAIMVVGNGMSTESEIKSSLKYFHSTNLLGVILNKAEVVTRNYY